MDLTRRHVITWILAGTGAFLLTTVIVGVAAPSTGALLPWGVAAAGLADGINPCSFAGLLVFTAFTTASFEAAALGCHAPEPQIQNGKRTRLLRNGSTYIAGLFATYLLLGIGFMWATQPFAQNHVIGKLAALGSLAMGLWVLRDFFFPESRWKLEMPRLLKPRVRRILRATETPSVFAAGVLVGLCTVPCAGGIYLGVLALVSAQGTVAAGMGLLVLYNIMFVLPLIVVLAITTQRRVHLAVARWHISRRNTVKFVLGSIMVSLGLVTLFVLT